MSKTNSANASRAAILREAMETAYFDLKAGKNAADVITLLQDTLNDDAAMRGRFEGT